MSGKTVTRELEDTATTVGNGRSLILAGDGVPSDTADVGWLYIRTDATTGDLVLYTWDATAGVWDVMTA